MSSESMATHARVIRMKGEPGKAEETTKRWTAEIFPLIKKQSGFRGVSFMGNRKTGEGLSVTYWESEQAMKDARAQVRPQAEKLLGGMGGSITDEDECEVAALERFKPAKAGVWVRVTTVEGDPAKADDGIANYEEKILPFLKKQPGARSAHLLVNRKTGRTFAGSTWDTEQDLKNSDAAVAGLRDEAIKKIDGKGRKVEVFEVLFTEIPTPAGVAR